MKNLKIIWNLKLTSINLNEGVKELTPISLSKCKNAFDGDSNSGNSSEERQVEIGLRPKFIVNLADIWQLRKPFECERCGRAFARKDKLKEHCQRIHEKHLEFKCAICYRRFKSEGARASHQRNCLKMSYECKFCPYKADHKPNFLAHIRTHTSEKPFPCSYCSKSFAQKSNLNTHIKGCHKI